MSPPRPTTPPRPPPISSRPTNRPTSSKPVTPTTSFSFPHSAGQLSSKGHGVRGDVILLSDTRLLIHRYVSKYFFQQAFGSPCTKCCPFSFPDFGTTEQLLGSPSSQAPPPSGRHLLVSPSQWQRNSPLTSRCSSMMFSQPGWQRTHHHFLSTFRRVPHSSWIFQEVSPQTILPGLQSGAGSAAGGEPP